MKIVKHFNQKVFTRILNTLPVEPYFFQSFEWVQNKLKSDDTLFIKIYSKTVEMKETENVLIFFNTVNTNISTSLKNYVNISDKTRFLTNQIDFKTNSHWPELKKVLDENNIQALKTLKIRKEADFSHLKLIEINPSLNSVRCPFFNSLLSKGAQLESTLQTPKSYEVIANFDLSFRHGLKLLKCQH